MITNNLHQSLKSVYPFALLLLLQLLVPLPLISQAQNQEEDTASLQQLILSSPQKIGIDQFPKDEEDPELKINVPTSGSINREFEKTYKNLKSIQNSTIKDINSLKKKDTEYKKEIQELDKQSTDLSKKLEENQIAPIKNLLNRFWVLIAAILVFFMQAGFKALEVGLVRREHRAAVGMKNVLDWIAVSVAFMICGFGIMFGNEWGSLSIASDFFSEIKFNEYGVPSEPGWEFFLFQLAFAGTAATIVSGTMSGRTKMWPYFFIALIMGGFIYPFIGSMIWGNLYYNEIGNGWSKVNGMLYNTGFQDFAGSSVVHLVGACVALVGAWFVGPRVGYAGINTGPSVKRRIEPYNLGYAALGVFILWLGWWGFNGGSSIVFDHELKVFSGLEGVPVVIINTNISGVFGGFTAFLLNQPIQWIFKGNSPFEQNAFFKLIGGILGGLVAITACADILTPQQAILVGIVAGIIHNVALELLFRFRVLRRWIDDPVGAIPVHGACGIVGILMLAIGNPVGYHKNIEAYDSFESHIHTIALKQGLTSLDSSFYFRDSTELDTLLIHTINIDTLKKTVRDSKPLMNIERFNDRIRDTMTMSFKFSKLKQIPVSNDARLVNLSEQVALDPTRQRIFVKDHGAQTDTLSIPDPGLLLFLANNQSIYFSKDTSQIQYRSFDLEVSKSVLSYNIEEAEIEGILPTYRWKQLWIQFKGLVYIILISLGLGIIFIGLIALPVGLRLSLNDEINGYYK